MFQTLKRVFRAYFLTGLLVLGPLVISVYVIKIIIDTADNVFVTNRWLPLPGLGVFVALLLILLAGFLAKNVLGRFLFAGAGDVIARIPIIGGIYSSTKQVFEALLGNGNSQFGRVVLIPYPHNETFTLAFVTSETIPSHIQKLFPEPVLSVYVPTTPNPTSGFFLYVAKSKVRDTQFSVDTAFKEILSLGMARSGGPR
jgi:uncharacterized membrane protein